MTVLFPAPEGADSMNTVPRRLTAVSSSSRSRILIGATCPSSGRILAQSGSGVNQPDAIMSGQPARAPPGRIASPRLHRSGALATMPDCFALLRKEHSPDHPHPGHRQELAPRSSSTSGHLIRRYHRRGPASLDARQWPLYNQDGIRRAASLPRRGGRGEDLDQATRASRQARLRAERVRGEAHASLLGPGDPVVAGPGAPHAGEIALLHQAFRLPLPRGGGRDPRVPETEDREARNYFFIVLYAVSPMSASEELPPRAGPLRRPQLPGHRSPGCNSGHRRSHGVVAGQRSDLSSTTSPGLLYLLLDAIVDDYFPAVDSLRRPDR